MSSWSEPLPGFKLPPNWIYDPVRWPDYTTDLIASKLEEIDELGELFRVRGWGRPSSRAWGVWLRAERTGAPLSTEWIELQQIADLRYDQARYVYLVPAWRRAITTVIGELDNLEDQLTTILWVAEWITRKVIPLPKTLMNRAQQVRRTLDCTEKFVAGITPFRSGKSEYVDCLREKKRALRRAQNQRAGLLAWFRDNWGKLLETAQATDTWFEVGIVLGPVFGWIEEGIWGLAQKTTDNYLIAVDALAPGYRDDFWRSAQEISERVDEAWDTTWETLSSWDAETIADELPGFTAP